VADDAPRMDYTFESNGLELSAHLSEPPGATNDPPGLVLCHGFPARGRYADASGKSFPELADRIANDLGWVVLTINFRGSGGSQGDFSLAGWTDDISAAVAHVRSMGVSGVWLCGFGSGGSLCLVAAARDREVKGAAVFASPADFTDWARNPRRLLLHAREVGVVTDPEFPPSFDKWSQELRRTSPVNAASDVGPRPLLIVHGEADDLVPSLDARLLADAHGDTELRIIAGAGHELRHDPRSVAVLLGWLARQHDLEVAR
jgi:dipeptidyl aminopeptidase/acylaminoacyl peptidase